MTTTTLNPDQVVVGTSRGAGLWIAPVGTPPPSPLETDFSGAWLSLGYASEDGITFAQDSTSESITPQQSRVPIRTLTTEKTVTLAFTMWQLNAVTLALYFDTAVPTVGGSGISLTVRSDDAPRLYAVAVDVKDGDRMYRTVFPRASLEATDDLTITKSAAVPLGITLSALDDAGILSTNWVSTIDRTPRKPRFTTDLPATFPRPVGNWAMNPRIAFDAWPSIDGMGGRNSIPDPGGVAPFPALVKGYRWEVETSPGSGDLQAWPNQGALYMTGASVPQVGTRIRVRARNEQGETLSTTMTLTA